MSIIKLFLFGYLAAVVGVTPPGLINMTAAKISLIDGKKRSMVFVLGALLLIFFQTYISVFFAQYINLHNEVVILLREIGLIIFLVLTIYFFKFAKKPTISHEDHAVVKSKRSRFFVGMFVSAINFFPIPYYVLISITLASYGILAFNTLLELSFVIGAVLGSSTIFYLYVVFFNKLKSKADFFINNMNKIIGTITGIVALLTLFNLAKYYF